MNTQNSAFELYQRIGRIICYYFLAAPWTFKPTWQEYQEWLDTLSNEERIFYEELGFQTCQAANAFRKYWLEEREYHQKDYLRMHLIPQDYAMYCQMRPIYEFHPTKAKRSLVG